MYRLYGALGILMIIIILTFCTFRVNTDTAGHLGSRLENAFTLAESGSVEESELAMNDALGYIESRSGLLCAIISHKMIDDIRIDMEKAQVCLNRGEISLFLAHCKSAIFRTRDLRELEYPTLMNIF